MNQIEFRTGVIRPLECFKEGWELIKPHYWLIFGITFVGMLIAGAIPFAIAMGAMYCGIYYCIFQLMQGRKPEFGDLFKGFNYFMPALIATLIFVVPMVIFTVITWISMFTIMFGMTDSRGQLDSSAIVTLYAVLIGEGVIFGIIMSCIHVFIMFTYPLIVEYNLSGPDAFKLSARAGWANLGGVVGLIIWEFILGFIGYLVCAIGLYFVLPVLFAGVLVAYRRVFPAAPGSRI
jgi:hypothetical protein